MANFDLMKQLAADKGGKMILLIMDGLGGLQPLLNKLNECRTPFLLCFLSISFSLITFVPPTKPFMKQFFQHPIALFSIAFVLLYGCSSGLKESTNGSAAADSSLIEPVTVNNLFLDSMTLADFLHTHPEYKEQQVQVWKFYSMRNYQFAWFNNDGMVEQASHMMNKLTHLREEGITDTVTGHTRLQQLYDTLSGGSYHLTGVDAINSEAELLLTATFFKYAEKIWGGIGEKDVEEVEWFIKKKRLPYVYT